MLSLKWFCLVILLAECANGSKSPIDDLRLNISQDWSADLEPVIENLSKRLRRELLPLVHDILTDEEISTDCLRSLVKLSSGLNEHRLWAMKCEFPHHLDFQNPLTRMNVFLRFYSGTAFSRQDNSLERSNDAFE